MKFTVVDDVLKLGVKVAIITIRGMNNAMDNMDFNRYAIDTIREMKNNLTISNIENDSILNGFWTLHENIGKTSKHDIPSPVALLTMLLTTEGMPNINLIVDIYNLVSLKTRLSLGAHDITKINGNVTLKIAEGTEEFLPIGYTHSKKISKGEYAYIDDANDVLCRMEVKQVEKTKVTEATTDCLYIIQGNANTTNEQIKEAIDMLSDLTTKYCGGNTEIIYQTW